MVFKNLTLLFKDSLRIRGISVVCTILLTKTQYYTDFNVTADSRKLRTYLKHTCPLKSSVVDPSTLIGIRIQNFGPFWIRIQNYVINLEENKFLK